MRLTLRTMLAYLDDVLTEADSHELGQKIDSSDFATGLVHRIRNSISQLRLSSPELLGSDSMDDPNTVAEFIDSSLSPEKEQEFEKVCLQSDKHLAEVASSHQILTMVLGTPARVSPRLRDRVYRTGIPGDGADSPVPASPGRRREAFRRADVTDAALAIEDEEPIDIKRPRPVSDSRATLAEFGQRRNLWTIAAALLLGFVLTGGFLFAMGPLNSSHPLAGLLGLRDVQVAESDDAPVNGLAEQLETPDIVVPNPGDEFAVEQALPEQLPTTPPPPLPSNHGNVADPVPPPVEVSNEFAAAEPNTEWQVPGQVNVENQVPEFDQIPDFPVAETPAAETQAAIGDENSFFNTPELIPETPAVVTDEANAAVDQFVESQLEGGQPEGPALDRAPERIADLRDPSARPATEDGSIGFGDPLVGGEATTPPPVPEATIPGLAIPDPNTLADNGANRIFDEPFDSDPAASLENGIAENGIAENGFDENRVPENRVPENNAAPGVDADAGFVDVSASDDEPVAEEAVVEPEPEAQVEAGRFLSEDQVLLYLNEEGTWMRLAPRTVFGVGHRLRMLENYRTQLLLSLSNIQFTSRGDSEIVFDEPIDGNTATLEVPFGRFILNSNGQGGSRFALRTGERVVAIEFAEPNTEIVCQVRPILLPGVDPRREPPHGTVQIWVTRGSVKVMEDDREEQVDIGQQYAFADDIEARVISFDRVPEWLTRRIDPVDRDVAIELEGLLPVGRDVVLSLTEAADS